MQLINLIVTKYFIAVVFIVSILYYNYFLAFATVINDIETVTTVACLLNKMKINLSG